MLEEVLQDSNDKMNEKLNLVERAIKRGLKKKNFNIQKNIDKNSFGHIIMKELGLLSLDEGRLANWYPGLFIQTFQTHNLNSVPP